MSQDEGTFLGKVDDLGEGRAIMMWLIDGNILTISDYWKPTDLARGGKKILLVGFG